MKCRDFDRVLSDYLDGEAEWEQRRGVESHSAECGDCAGKLADAELALEWLQRAPEVDPPAELVDSILQGALAAGAPALAGGPSGAAAFRRPFFSPLMQPRLAMSLAMTMLWLSLMAFYGRGAWERLGAREGGATVLAAGITDGLDQAWETGLELYETTVMLYRLQTEFGDGEMHITAPEPLPAGVPAGEPNEEEAKTGQQERPRELRNP